MLKRDEQHMDLVCVTMIGCRMLPMASATISEGSMMNKGWFQRNRLQSAKTRTKFSEHCWGAAIGGVPPSIFVWLSEGRHCGAKDLTCFWQRDSAYNLGYKGRKTSNFGNNWETLRQSLKNVVKLRERVNIGLSPQSESHAAPPRENLHALDWSENSFNRMRPEAATPPPPWILQDPSGAVDADLWKALVDCIFVVICLAKYLQVFCKV